MPRNQKPDFFGDLLKTMGNGASVAHDSVLTAGHAAVAMTAAVADAATGGTNHELKQARQQSERKMHAHARKVERGAKAAASDAQKVASTSYTTLGALAHIAVNARQRKRLNELVFAHDFPALLRALVPKKGGGEELDPAFFGQWVLQVS